MAASQSPIVWVPSRCTSETARATVAFEVVGYSLHKGLGKGNCLCSPAFSLGGYEWCIRYFPDGSKSEGGEGYVAVFLKLLTKNVEVRAIYNFTLVDPVKGRSGLVRSSRPTKLFGGSTATTAWGHTKFMTKNAEMESVYLRDDRLLIECDIEVIKETLAPPSDLSDDLAKLLAEKKGADVTFSVQGESFSAHRIVLAMRSPVFDAEFYGPMGDKEKEDITIEDMQPAVFKAFLHFIYTDSMPSMGDLVADDKTEMVKHLLVAADKYGMERMKMICEGMLCKSIYVETVAAKLALADQYHCTNLKDACIEFMLSSNRMDDVIASQGYVHLKRSHTGVIVDVFERAAKSRKI